MSGTNSNSKNGLPQPIRLKHIKPFRKRLKLTQDEFAILLHLESRTTVTNWENDLNQDKELKKPIQLLVWHEMMAAKYNPGNVTMLNDFRHNLGTHSADYNALLKEFDSLINQTVSGTEVENFIDRIALFRTNFTDASSAIICASTVESHEVNEKGEQQGDRVITDDDLITIVNLILQDKSTTYSDHEPYQEITNSDHAYIKRQFDDTDIGLLLLTFDKRNAGPFYTEYQIDQPKLAATFREIMYAEGIMKRPK